MVQIAPGARVDGQLFVPLNAKSVGLVPAMLMTMLLREALPTLVIAVLIGDVVRPLVKEVKVSAVGLNVTAGAVMPVPVKLVDMSPTLGMLSSNCAL